MYLFKAVLNMWHIKIFQLQTKSNMVCYMNHCIVRRITLTTPTRPKSDKKLYLATIDNKKNIRAFHLSEYLSSEQKDEYYAKLALKETKSKELASKEFFEDTSEKNRETFKNAIELFNKRDIRKRGSVEFIYAALKHMKQFDCNR